MQDSIICPNCKKSIPLTQAITQQIDEKYRLQLEEERKKSEEEKQRLIVAAQKRIQEEKQKTAKEMEEQLKKKIQDEMALKLKDGQNEREELRNQNKALQEQLLEMNKLMRLLKTEQEQSQLMLEKKLAEEQSKIREEEQKRLDEQFRLKMQEKEKQLMDAIKVNEELKRKLEQGSQQAQGEVLELMLEELLKKEFVYDDIKPVPKGINGADIIQIVKTPYGKTCGTIVWETKRTKSWSQEWVSKLKDDQRNLKAELAVILSQVLPQDVKNFGYLDGVWVGSYESIIGISYALRSQLLEVAALKSSAEGKKEKMEVLYQYLTGIEFKQRVEAILEAFTSLQTDIEKEKRWFAQKWAKQEKNLRKVFDNTLGMQGELQSIVGKALPQVAGLELDTSTEQETSELEEDVTKGDKETMDTLFE